MPSPAVTSPVNGHPRVLIVDGHEVSRGVWSALLRTEGLQVVADVADAEQGVAAAEALAPDLVLLDVACGDHHILDTIAALQALPSRPTVLLTSSTPRSALRLLPDGVSFLAKGDISARALLSAIAPVAHATAVARVLTDRR
jgi:CheY-like chemotaxis protein